MKTTKKTVTKSIPG